jgi:hypothetical protein
VNNSFEHGTQAIIGSLCRELLPGIQRQGEKVLQIPPICWRWSFGSTASPWILPCYDYLLLFPPQKEEEEEEEERRRGKLKRRHQDKCPSGKSNESVSVPAA